MTNIFRMIALAVVAVFVSISAMADTQDGSRQAQREKFAEVQAQQLATQMKLSDEQAKQLVTTYVECQRELWKIGKPRHDNGKSGKKVSMTEDEARKELTGRFSHWRKFNDIQEKYYKEYSKFLTQVQIYQFYELERRQMDKMRKRGPQKPTKKQVKGAARN